MGKENQTNAPILMKTTLGILILKWDDQKKKKEKKMYT